MKEVLQQFWQKSLPLALEKLIDFQEQQSGFECYSQGFGVCFDDKDGLKHGWCNNPDFLAKLYPFAQANGTGSYYAFWDNGLGLSLDEMPVVVFGDEGGEWVVAKNFLELLQLLSYDTEIYVDYDRAGFFKLDEDDEYYYESDDAVLYREWLQEHFGDLPFVDNDEQAGAITQVAQQTYQQAFNDWLSNYGIND